MSTSDKKMAAILAGQAMDAARWSGDYWEAIRLFSEALQYDPDSGDIYHNRGMAYRSLERLPEAISDFSSAIKLSPHPSSYEQRGMAYYQMGDRDSAFNDWLQVLRTDPSRTFSALNLAWLAIEDGQFSRAVELCSHVIQIEPTLAKAYENRARAYLEMGDQSRGFADLQMAQDLVESGRDTS